MSHNITFDIRSPTIESKLLQKLNKVKSEMEREFNYEYTYKSDSKPYMNETKILRRMKLEQDIKFIIYESGRVEMKTHKRISLENIKQIEKILGLVVGFIEIFQSQDFPLTMEFMTKDEYVKRFCVKEIKKDTTKILPKGTNFYER